MSAGNQSKLLDSQAGHWHVRFNLDLCQVMRDYGWIVLYNQINLPCWWKFESRQNLSAYKKRLKSFKKKSAH